MAEGTVKKESTILDLSRGIADLLEDLGQRLDSRFNRSPKPEGKGEDSPQEPNVLDEIIDVLERDKRWLSRHIEFLVSEVLPKIS